VKLKLDDKLKAKLRGLAVSLSMGLMFNSFPETFSQALRELADEIDRQNNG